MTRRSIATVLTSLLVCLFVAVNAHAVSADNYCEMGAYDECGQIPTNGPDALSIMPTAVSAEGGCDAADAGTADQCVALVAQRRDFTSQQIAELNALTVTGTDVVMMPAVDDAALLHAQVVASPAQTTEPRAIYRVAGSVYYIPLSDGMWAVLDYQSDGIFVIEDYVSGPPPANGVALDAASAQTRDTSCDVVPAPCFMP